MKRIRDSKDFVEYLRNESNVLQNEALFIMDKKLNSKYITVSSALRISADYIEKIIASPPNPDKGGKEKDSE